MVIHHDITELREAEETTRRLNEILEERAVLRTAELAASEENLRSALDAERQLNLLKSRFVGIVSHEFRTPLGIIMSAVELLGNYADRLSPEQQGELIENVRTSTLRMAGIMEQVLLLGRSDAGRIDCRVAPLSVAELAGKLVAECTQAEHQRCPINLAAEGDLSGARGDEALLRHILTNLLSNAVKYSTAGEPVRLRACRDGTQLVLTVSDRGIGIPESDQTAIFEAFHRAGNVGERPGTGLGLLIVQRCVELHGGTLTLDSREGEGSIFTVRLPVFPADTGPD